jgi:hypothetical protein
MSGSFSCVERVGKFVIAVSHVTSSASTGRMECAAGIPRTGARSADVSIPSTTRHTLSKERKKKERNQLDHE